MKRTNDRPLQERPDVFYAVGMHITTDVFLGLQWAYRAGVKALAEAMLAIEQYGADQAKHIVADEVLSHIKWLVAAALKRLEETP